MHQKKKKHKLWLHYKPTNIGTGPYQGFFVCGGKLRTPSQGSPVYRFWTNIATKNSPAESNTILEKKKLLVFLMGATVPLPRYVGRDLYY